MERTKAQDESTRGGGGGKGGGSVGGGGGGGGGLSICDDDVDDAHSGCAEDMDCAVDLFRLISLSLSSFFFIVSTHLKIKFTVIVLIVQYNIYFLKI